MTIDWQSSDDSGTASDPADTNAATEGADVAYTSAESCDPSGNCGTGSLNLSLDLTPPTVSCLTSTPKFILRATDQTVVADVTDALSGPANASASAPADTTSVGAKTVELTGEDLAGNTTTLDCPYLVTFAFEGFSAPVQNDRILNVIKAGAAVPLKWRLTDANGVPVTNLASASVTVHGITCDAGTTEDQLNETVAGSSGLQNLGDGYYQLNWKTPKSYAASCKRLQLDLGDGIDRTALFKFR